MYVTVDFICNCTVALYGTRNNRDSKMKNSCPQWDSISGPLARQIDALSITPRGRLNVIIYRRTIYLLMLINIAPRADVDRWNQIDCFIRYRNVIQYMTFLLLTMIVDYVSLRTQCNTRENTFESVSDDDKRKITLVHKISHLCGLRRLLVWCLQGSTRLTIQITQKYINHASHCGFITHKY